MACRTLPTFLLRPLSKVKKSSSFYPSSVPTIIPSSEPTNAPQGSSSSKQCFSGSETVTLNSGVSALISQVQLGDFILSADAAGNLKYSEVVAIPHAVNDEKATFIEISTVMGRDIKMTMDHLVFAGDCNTADFVLTSAAQVVVGSCLKTVSGPEEIVAVNSVESRGLYTIVVKEEFVVVNGIVASPFAVNHVVANAFYNIHRFLLPRLSPAGMIQRTLEAFAVLISV